MGARLYKPFNLSDEDGTKVEMSIEQQALYPNRFDLIFTFCGKSFKIQHFGTERDATNFWELIEGVSGRKEAERGLKLLKIETHRRRKLKEPKPPKEKKEPKKRGRKPKNKEPEIAESTI